MMKYQKTSGLRSSVDNDNGLLDRSNDLGLLVWQNDILFDGYFLSPNSMRTIDSKKITLPNPGIPSLTHLS